MSDTFIRNEVTYKPKEVLNGDVKSFYTSGTNATITKVEEESLKIADRLLEHLSLIKKYQDRLDTIDYLSDNASTLSNDLSYTTEDEDIKSAIIAYGYTGNTVTFEMFKKAIDDIINNYQSMTIDALAGINS